MPWVIAVQLTIAVPLVLLNWYIGRRIVRSLTVLSGRPSRLISRLTASTLVVFNLLPIAAAAAFAIVGRRATPAFAGDNIWIDLLVVYPFWTWLVILVQASFVMGVMDITSGIVRRIRRRPPFIGSPLHARSALAIVCVIALLSIGVIFNDTSSARVHTIDVPLPRYASGLDGLRIVQISDVQGDGRTSPDKIGRFIDQARSLQPDVVLNCGDIVTSGESHIASTTRLLGNLQAPLGHFAAVGDHDLFSNKRMVMAGLRSSGITVFDDTTLSMTWRRVPIALTLMTYTYPQKLSPATIAHLVRSSADTFHILLVHQPAQAIVESASRAGVDLMLAGHTHGGGVTFRIPGLGAIAPARFESRYMSGRYDVGRMVLNVTNGLGFTLAPIRYGAPLEISLIRLHASPGDAS